MVRAKVLSAGIEYDPKKYEYNDKFTPSGLTNAFDVHTTPELVAFLEKDNKADIDARIFVYSKEQKRFQLSRLNKTQFVETYKNNLKRKTFNFKEGYFDSFATSSSPYSDLIGKDYIPVLGGPFHKQLYLYDYLRMTQLAFWAYNHDAMARFIIHCTRDFVLGRGYRVDSKNKKALAIWRAFEEANNLQQLMEYLVVELSIYGEIMLWWLPDNATKIVQNPAQGEKIPKGIIPRIRVIDPSVIWEIVTHPEDITRVLFYQWSSPTQYQIYTGVDNGVNVSSAKFIYQQIPADQVEHVKINCVSNEKRGRSDLFPILGDLKRLRDVVDYHVVAAQKTAAWCLDTTIEGSQADLDAYVADQQSMGQYAPAGSEFVHTDKIKREYLGNHSGGSGGFAEVFNTVMNKIVAGSGIPYTYFGLTSASGTGGGGSSTRAGAMVGTEPVAKKFQMRQLVLERVVHKLWKRVMEWAGMDGIEDAVCEVTFPEVIVQDRSQKIKDLVLGEEAGYWSKERAATVSAKEMAFNDYEYLVEKEKITKEGPMDPMVNPAGQVVGPLTTPGQKSGGELDTTPKPNAVTQQDKKKVAMNHGA